MKDDSSRFGFKNGLNIAFAFTDYSSDMDKKMNDTTKVTMTAELRGWGVPENSLSSVYRYIPLNTHWCTEEEMGFIPEHKSLSKFYPADAD